MNELKLFLIAGALVLPAPAAFAKPMTASPTWAGTWMLNLTDSKFATPGRRSELRTYRVAGNQVRMESRGIGPDGRSVSFRYAAVYDNKWYPMVGNPIGNRIALQLINPRHVRAKVRRDNRDTAVASVTVSTDGRRLILNRTTLNARGAPIIERLIYDKLR
jgi:hypothetical protein